MFEHDIVFINFFTGEFGTVAGWGRLSEGGVLPSILQHVGIIFICPFNRTLPLVNKYSVRKHLP